MRRNSIVLGAALLVVIVGGIFWQSVVAPRVAPLPALSSMATSTEASDLISVASLTPGSVIKSPLVITGEARGPWYFEASFPVILTDWDGKIIAQVPAQAQGDWMTTDLVPFRAELSFTVPAYGDTGTLILKKDNPSGLPEHDNAIEIPIRFR